VAFRWIDNPLAWTYTTIHTRNSTPAAPVDCEVLPQPGRVGVAIVEPDAGIRQSLAWCLNQMTGFYCAAAFKSASQAVSELPHYSLQLVLINRSLADGPGLTQLNGLKNKGREIATLIYSVYPNSETLFAATPGGAVCYLLRRRPATEFLEPIHNLTTPGSLSKKELTLAAWQYFKNIFALHPADGAGQVSTNLTQREHEVLALLSNGHPDKEIASRLGISIYTVHEHVRNIFEKLGVHSRTSAVVKYLQK
jgi:DNA-binding NarL/FixJ family response regulator